MTQRYETVRRRDLPANFRNRPAAVLEDMAKEYRRKVHKTDPETAQAYHDWAVRVELDPAGAIPVTNVGVDQREKWVEFLGVVARVRQPIPRAISLAWVCAECDSVMYLDAGEKPGICTCKSRRIYQDKSLSIFVDSQNVTLAEYFEEVRGTRPPRMLECRLDGPLILSMSPGDRCVVGGVMDLRATKSGYEYEFVVNNVMQFSTKRRVDPPAIKGDVMAVLVESFAPHIYGHHTIKESTILLLAGGSSAITRRQDINILLVGDPGIAKSTILQAAAEAAPLGRYTSGRGSTAAGLTAGMARDKDGVMYLEAGAAVLTDGGILCLDEFDKMTASDRAALHEVMEQQTASIAKLGTFVTMNARVSVLAAANPKQGFWDDTLSLAENIDLPQSMLTRFDLIYNLRDIPNADADRMIARHILGGDTPNTLVPEAITAYISSIRTLAPSMSGEATEAIEQYYVRARSDSGEIRITPRQLEAVKRLAGARAKIYRHDTITKQDATRAIYLVENMIQHAMVDPATGKPDHMKATGGRSRSLIRLVDEATAAIPKEFTAADIAGTVKATFQDIERALERLNTQGILVESSAGVYERVK